jgi:myo-inositol-1(or 4)-monophosphatase
MSQFSDDLMIARTAAQAGAKIVRDRFGRSQEARLKGNSKGLVTRADTDAETAILDVLSSGSSYGILSEESGVSGKEAGLRWVVDPLDGTTNFTRSLPLCAVSVALVDGPRVLVGVIIDPVRETEFCAELGVGAFCKNEMLRLPPYETEFGAALFVDNGYGEADRKRLAAVTQRLSTSYHLLKLGTTALELCYVASGSVEGFICSGDELWDFAAGVVIAKEAGCVFTDWQGRPWDGKSTFILIARPEVHAELVDQIKDLQ